ncbi:MAG TPA: FAD-dependent oxidoreductase, partial [Actinomycetota bacterium]|nr:FAD-dependent oxidoreductase [Actinomycetota bacterium]
MERADVVIVGAGVVGLAAAWRLAERGADVVVLERFHLAHDRGSSHGATRIFRFAYDDPTYVDLARRALPLWRALEDKADGELVHMTGGLDIGDDAYLEATARALTDSGAAVEQLGPDALRDRFIWLDAGDRRALYSPDTGVIAAADAVAAFARAARDAGARIMELTPCDGINAGTDRVEVDAPGEPI